jgi:hypothetical protein
MALTYTDIETRVMNAIRMPTTNVTEQAKVQNWINMVYRDICAKQDWHWLEKRQVVNTRVKYDTGTVNVTLGSTGFTFSSNPGFNVVGDALTVPGNANDALAVYRVATSAASYTLDAAYTGLTSTAAAFRVYQDTIPVSSDVAKLLQVKRFGEFLPLRLIGKNAMAQLKIYDTSEGKPEVACLDQYVTTGDPTTQRLLWIHPYPDKAYRLELLYKQWNTTELTGTARPLIPDEFAEVLVYGTLARYYVIAVNDPERSKYYQDLFNDLLSLMAAQNKEYTRDNPQVQPMDDYRRLKRRRGRTGGGVTLGTWFDRLPTDW